MFALLNGVEKKERGGIFTEVKTAAFYPSWASCEKKRRRGKKAEQSRKWGTEKVKKGGELEGRESCGKEKGERYVSTYCRWQVAWSLEPACLSERSAQVCVCVCGCVCARVCVRTVTWVWIIGRGGLHTYPTPGRAYLEAGSYDRGVCVNICVCVWGLLHHQSVSSPCLCVIKGHRVR